MLMIYYGKPVLLFIDEYDFPIIRAKDNGYYGEMLKLLKKLLGHVLKYNAALKFAVVPGSLPVAKECIFTDAEEIKAYTVSDE